MFTPLSIPMSNCWCSRLELAGHDYFQRQMFGLLNSILDSNGRLLGHCMAWELWICIHGMIHSSCQVYSYCLYGSFKMSSLNHFLSSMLRGIVYQGHSTTVRARRTSTDSFHRTMLKIDHFLLLLTRPLDCFIMLIRTVLFRNDYHVGL